MSWAWPVLTTLIVSTAALVGSGVVLWIGKARPAVVNALLSVAVGTLLGAALLDLIPEAIEHGGEPEAVLGRVLLGILGFLALERLVRWRHPHEAEHPESVAPAAAALVLWGDALHNLVDGFVIGSAFGAGANVGVSTAIAVVMHEIPQEVADFAVLLAAGMPWRRALLLNWLVQLPPVFAAGATYLLASEVAGAVAWLMPLAAGSLVYIALADLVPSLHHHAAGRAAVWQLALVAAGVSAIAAIGHLGH